MTEQKITPVASYMFPSRDNQPISFSLTNVASRIDRFRAMSRPDEILREMPGIQRAASYGRFLQGELRPPYTTQDIKDLLTRELTKKEAVLKAIVKKNEAKKVGQDVQNIPDAQYKSDGSEPQIANVLRELSLLHSAIQTGDIHSVVASCETAVLDRENYLQGVKDARQTVVKAAQNSSPRATLAQIAGTENSLNVPSLDNIILKLQQTFPAHDVHGNIIPGKNSQGIISEASGGSTDSIVLTDADYQTLDRFSQVARSILQNKTQTDPGFKQLSDTVMNLQRTDKAFQILMAFGGKGVVADPNVSTITVTKTTAGPVIHVPNSIYDLWRAEGDLKFLSYALDKKYNRPLPPSDHPDNFIVKTAGFRGRTGTTFIDILQRIQKVL